MVLGLKKVGSTSTFLEASAIEDLGIGLDWFSASDKVFISMNMVLDSCNLVFSLKFKDVTNEFCIFLAFISLLSCLSYNIVIVFYFSCPTVWVGYSSSLMECNQV